VNRVLPVLSISRLAILKPKNKPVVMARDVNKTINKPSLFNIVCKEGWAIDQKY
jgi:hypothetical protein